MAAAHGAASGHDASERAGVAHADAMRAARHTDAVEHTSSKSPGMDNHRHRREPVGGGVIDRSYQPGCMPAVDMSSDRAWFDCNGPTKSPSGRK
jgi:hypothetical protein